MATMSQQPFDPPGFWLLHATKRPYEDPPLQFGKPDQLPDAQKFDDPTHSQKLTRNEPSPEFSCSGGWNPPESPQFATFCWLAHVEYDRTRYMSSAGVAPPLVCSVASGASESLGNGDGVV
jgi:hypothetical protein